MSDTKYAVTGRQLGTRRVRGSKAAYGQALDRGKQHITELAGMGDIQPENMRAGAYAGESAKDRTKNVVFDLPVSMAVARAQIPDLFAWPMDEQGLNIAVAAAAVDQVIVRIPINLGIRGIVDAFGWYTTAPGAPNLQFGLYIGEEMVLPGGRYIGGQPRTTNAWNPSGGSINAADLCETHIPVYPSQVVTIKATNTDALNAYAAWGRIRGWHWEDEPREAGDRAYYNSRTDAIG